MAANPEAEVVIEFNARFTEEGDTSGYPKNALGYPEVPNVAEYSYTDNGGNRHDKPSDVVKVVPPIEDNILPSPPEVPEIKKFVNDDPVHYDLAEWDEIFTYTIKTEISKNAEKFVIEDTLVNELEFAGSKEEVTVFIGGKDETSGVKSITVNEQTLTIELAKEQLVKLEGK